VSARAPVADRIVGLRASHALAGPAGAGTHAPVPADGRHTASPSILVVESAPLIGEALVEQLAADGYRARLGRTAEHARVMARHCAPSLVILGDLDSSRGALELLEEIRAAQRGDAPWWRDLPIIMVSARSQELDLLRAFEAGADDFLPSPARYLELRARLRAILRRTEGVRDVRDLQIGPLAIDTTARAVSLSGQRIRLRRLEYELLLRLAEDPKRVFGKQELLHAVWGYRTRGSTRTVDSHASRLRRKLDADGARRWVINVWGVGYRLL
jgi:DNA-binding response OmpR family regulator